MVVTEDTVHVCTGDVRPRYIVAVGSQDCQGLLPSFLIRSCCFSYAIHKHLDLLSRTIPGEFSSFATKEGSLWSITE